MAQEVAIAETRVRAIDPKQDAQDRELAIKYDIGSSKDIERWWRDDRVALAAANKRIAELEQAVLRWQALAAVLPPGELLDPPVEDGPAVCPECKCHRPFHHPSCDRLLAEAQGGGS